MTADLRRSTLETLSEWTAIHSVRGDDAGLGRMAAAVTAFLRRRIGAEIVDTSGHAGPPLVHARIDGGHPATILLYNMYDVMPAAAEGWAAAPFVGGIVDLPVLGPSFVGRGAENNKGPLAGMLVALEALLATDSLPAHIEILIEGEEESGSGAMRAYLTDPIHRVRRCGAALFPSFCEYGGLRPRVYLGSKGIAHGLIRLADGPSRPIHSSNVPWIANPAWSLVTTLAALTAGPNGWLGRVDLPPHAQPTLAALAAGFDPDAELRFRQTAAFHLDGDRRSLLEAVLTTTSLNLASIRTDPPDGRAVIPALAEARFDLRLPPGVAPDAVLAELRTRLGPAAELVVEDAYPGTSFAADATGVRALCETYARFGVDPQVWPWAIGAAPAYAFAETAGSFLMGGLGHGGNAHGRNEFVTLAGLDRFLDFVTIWLPATARSLVSEERTREF